jgi:uncharacterized protein
MPASARDNPFRTITARALLAQTLLLFVGLTLPFVFIAHQVGVNEPLGRLCMTSRDLLFYLGWAVLILRQMQGHGVDLGRLAGPNLAPRRWWPYGLLVLLLLCFSWGTFLLFVLISSWFNPLLGQSILSGATAPGLADQFWLIRDLELFTVVIVAPIVEELAFRGFLLQRWSSQWGVTQALLASSIFFGALHANLLGLSVFGLVMGLIYLRTGSLLVPIFCHALNNGLVTGVAFLGGSKLFGLNLQQLGQQFAQQLGVPTILMPGPWIQAGLMLLVSTPLLALYIREQWPRPNTPVPYLKNADLVPALVRSGNLRPLAMNPLPLKPFVFKPLVMKSLPLRPLSVKALAGRFWSATKSTKG